MPAELFRRSLPPEDQQFLKLKTIKIRFETSFSKSFRKLQQISKKNFRGISIFDKKKFLYDKLCSIEDLR